MCSSDLIPSTVLGNSTHYIGTTAVTLNRASGPLALTGITSIDGNAATATTASTANALNSANAYTGTSFNSITGLSSTTPVMDGTAAIGTSTTVARADHVHGSDTSKASLSGATFTGAVSGTSATFSAVVAALDFNSTSDEKFKTNIETISNSLEKVKEMRGVSFDWKETGKGTFGVIAQEIEKIVPELVSEIDGHKTVNYNGIIGFLINAIKELSDKVDQLQK